MRLLELTLIRVGNEEYARNNKSFGLTTMRDSHAQCRGSKVRFRFRGKSGKYHDIDFNDARLARIVRRCQELPGQELFQYLDDDGDVQDIDSADVNDYLRDVTGQDFTAKDFRTWAGTVLAARALQEMAEFTSTAQAKHNVRRRSRRCGSSATPSGLPQVLHPPGDHRRLHRWLTAQTLSMRASQRLAQSASLSRTETAVLALLQRRLRRDAQRQSA